MSLIYHIGKLEKGTIHAPGKSEVIHVTFRLGSDELHLLSISRTAVENLDYEPFLKLLKLENLPKGRELAKCMGRNTFTIDGYDDDPREIWQIPEIREYFSGIEKIWSYWLFFCDIHNASFLPTVASILPNVRIVSRDKPLSPALVLPIDDLHRFISKGLMHMDELCALAGMSALEIWTRHKEVSEKFRIPFDVQRPI